MTRWNEDKNRAEHGAKTTIRDRWEAVRYGPVGRYLGFGLGFLAVFVLITSLLWWLENDRR